MKKFEPTYRLIRYGQATKVERASRQQRTYPSSSKIEIIVLITNRQATKESREDAQGRCQNEGRSWRQEEEISVQLGVWTVGCRGCEYPSVRKSSRPHIPSCCCCTRPAFRVKGSSYFKTILVHQAPLCPLLRALVSITISWNVPQIMSAHRNGALSHEERWRIIGYRTAFK